MQRSNFGNRMRYLVAVGTLVSAFALVACGGDDDAKDIAVTVPLTSSTVVAVQGVALAIPNGQILGTAANSAATLTFVNQSAFNLLESARHHGVGLSDLWPSLYRLLYVCRPPHSWLHPSGHDLHRHGL